MNRWVRYALIAFLIGGAWFIGVRQGKSTPRAPSRAVRESGYRYISPLILCNADASTDSPALEELRKQLQADIDTELNAKRVTRMGVYVGSLAEGRWTGVNADDTYAPASMLKLGILMVYLNRADEDPSLLEKRLRVDAGSVADDVEYYRSAPTVNPGDSFTVRELLEDMIIHSSNASLQALQKGIDPKWLDELYALLDIHRPSENDRTHVDFLSPREYAKLLRVLYNGTYLSRPSSEWALKLLTKTDFYDGLVAGLPAGTEVAHKFGERAFVSKDDPIKADKRELHDCGIIYLPNRPFLTCVMTAGTSYPDMAKAIATVASTVDRFERMK